MKTTGLWMQGDDLIERRSADVEVNLEYAKALHNGGQHGSSELKHAAHFPAALIEKYLLDNGINMHEFMVNPTHIRRMLNDPALSHFRIWKGRVPNA